MTASSEVWLIEPTKAFGRTGTVDISRLVTRWAPARAAFTTSRAAASPGLETGGGVSVAIHASDCIKNVQDSVSEPSAQATTPLAEGDTVAVG